MSPSSIWRRAVVTCVTRDEMGYSDSPTVCCCLSKCFLIPVSHFYTLLYLGQSSYITGKSIMQQCTMSSLDSSLHNTPHTLNGSQKDVTKKPYLSLLIVLPANPCIFPTLLLTLLHCCVFLQCFVCDRRRTI